MFSGIVNSVLISLGHFELLFWPYQPQTRQTTVAWWKEVSDKIFYSIYTVRLAIKFHNTAVLHSENLPSLWKEPPFCDLHRHPQLMTFKHSPHHSYGNYDIHRSFLPLVPQSKSQGRPHFYTFIKVHLLQEPDLQLSKPKRAP